jgi:hypothetical protein
VAGSFLTSVVCLVHTGFMLVLLLSASQWRRRNACFGYSLTAQYCQHWRRVFVDFANNRGVPVTLENINRTCRPARPINLYKPCGIMSTPGQLKLRRREPTGSIDKIWNALPLRHRSCSAADQVRLLRWDNVVKLSLFLASSSQLLPEV